jgi:hypothetical protein
MRLCPRPRGLRPGSVLRQRLLPLLPLLPLAGCKLTEVTVAPGTRMVVAQSVLSQGAASQYVVLEYSLAGDSVPGPTGDSVPPDSPRFPIGGATVTIAHQSGPCAGRVDTLVEQPPVAAGAPGIYSGPVCPPAPGDTLALRVITPSGEVVSGTTTVPWTSARDVRLAGGASVRPGDTLALDRTRDTIKIGLTAVTGSGMQVEARPTINYQGGGRNALYAITDTLGMALPGDLVNPFEGDSGETIFRAGRYYTLAVALMDQNYWDFARSRTDPITGSGFINHLTGGLGVFGSVETTRYTLRVTAPQTDPREGTYRITGTLDGTPVDIRFNLYIDAVEPRLFSGFVDGPWVGGDLQATGDGFFNGGASDPNALLIYVPAGVVDSTGAYSLSGERTDDRSPFPLAAQLQGSTRTVTATLTAQQISGP